MPEPPSLRELERTLFALIRAPEGVAAALRPTGVSRRRLAALIDGDERLGPLGRVGIYADMYFLRLQDVLHQTFPKLRALLGDDDFGALSTDYLDACPSRHASLRFLGDRLPAFLADSTSARSRRRPLPAWFADLAALEWARYDVFDAADDPLRTMAQLQGLDARAFATLPLRQARAHRRVSVGHAVEDVWRSLHQLQPLATAAARPGQLLVWRQDTSVYHRRLDDLEVTLLDQLVPGTTFGAICEHIAGQSPDPAPTAFKLLARWASDGLLVDSEPA